MSEYRDSRDMQQVQGMSWDIIGTCTFATVPLTTTYMYMYPEPLMSGIPGLHSRSRECPGIEVHVPVSTVCTPSPSSLSILGLPGYAGGPGNVL